MVIGACRIELHLPENGSLKGKRKIIKSIKDRVRTKFNVSIAEVDYLDAHQHAMLGVACVSNDRRVVDAVLSEVVNLVERIRELQIIDYQTEIY